MSAQLEGGVRDAKIALIGALALDIRGSWGDNVDYRLSIMRDLCDDVEKPAWKKDIEENSEDICFDGRWFRCGWGAEEGEQQDGPYGSISKEDLVLSGYTDDVFEYPEYCVINYCSDDGSGEDDQDEN